MLITMVNFVERVNEVGAGDVELAKIRMIRMAATKPSSETRACIDVGRSCADSASEVAPI